MMMIPQLSLKKAFGKDSFIIGTCFSRNAVSHLLRRLHRSFRRNSFLLVGGEGPNGASGTIRRWDEATSTLQSVGAAMRTPRGGAAAVLIEAAAFPTCN